MRFVERTSDDLTRRLPQARESGVAPRAQFQKQAHLPIICPNFWPRKTLRSTRQRLLTHTSNRDEVPHPAAVPIFFNIGCRSHPCPRKCETHGGFHDPRTANSAIALVALFAELDWRLRSAGNHGSLDTAKGPAYHDEHQTSFKEQSENGKAHRESP